MTKPTKEQAEQAIRTILSYIGEDPDREGLLKTPERVVKSYSQLFSGYAQQAEDHLNTIFFETENYDEIILLKDIKLKSFCEHHFLPIIGKVDIAYIPNGHVVGISKLARIVEVYSRRVQIQEKLTAQIAEAIQKFLQPKGVAVRVSAVHHCMLMRGVMQDESVMDTFHFTGEFQELSSRKEEFMTMLIRK